MRKIKLKYHKIKQDKDKYLLDNVKFRDKNDQKINWERCLLTPPTLENNLIIHKIKEKKQLLRRSSRLAKKQNNVSKLPLLNAPKP